MIRFNSNSFKQLRNSILLLSQFSFLFKDLLPDSENEKLCTMLTRSFNFKMKYFRISNKKKRMIESSQAKWGWSCPRQKHHQCLCPGWGNLVGFKSPSFGPQTSFPPETYSLHLRDLEFKAVVVRLHCLTKSFPLSKL